VCYRGLVSCAIVGFFAGTLIFFSDLKKIAWLVASMNYTLNLIKLGKIIANYQIFGTETKRRTQCVLVEAHFIMIAIFFIIAAFLRKIL
jgi:hypothetical protein